MVREASRQGKTRRIREHHRVALTIWVGIETLNLANRVFANESSALGIGLYDVAPCRGPAQLGYFGRESHLTRVALVRPKLLIKRPLAVLRYREMEHRHPGRGVGYAYIVGAISSAPCLSIGPSTVHWSKVDRRASERVTIHT